MNNKSQPLANQGSPFHTGEQEIQEKLGVRDRMERFGRQVIRDFLPEQHRDFYQQLPYILVGHEDSEGWPWASILFGDAGFISSSNPESLNFKTKIPVGDPLSESLSLGLNLGMLGIDLSSRRRNRLSGKVTKVAEEAFDLELTQSFGNCPQYIQTRHLQALPQSQAEPVMQFENFNDEVSTLINNSDTFFVASHYSNQLEGAESKRSEGADVSHRGGKPGFVRIDSTKTLTIPDYLGNFHFNTFGNFLLNPKAGLLFIDFEQGHLLTLTGRVEIQWESEEAEHFEGAERLWQFHLEKGFLLKQALPFKLQFDEFSPTTLVTGTWQKSAELKKNEQIKNSWQNCTVDRIEQESSSVKSFYLKPESDVVSAFKAGQFLTVKALVEHNELTRTYTVSSAPHENYYRLSVKHEDSGAFSSFLHQQLEEGDTLQFKAPTGSFYIEANVQKPAVLLAGGIGITPMVSMLKHILHDSTRTRSIRPMILVCSLRNLEQRCFYQELKELVLKSDGYIKVYWVISDPESDAIAGQDYHYQGRIDHNFLQAVLPLDDYEFFLCGPVGFMQAMYDLCLELGVEDHRVMAESFGPASLRRRIAQSEPVAPLTIAAENAIVEFSNSKFEQPWSAEDGNLLEFSESHGLNPEYGCRNGQCGSCKVKLLSGQVSYRTTPNCDYATDEVVLCCAVPSKDDDDEISRLALCL